MADPTDFNGVVIAAATKYLVANSATAPTDFNGVVLATAQKYLALQAQIIPNDINGAVLAGVQRYLTVQAAVVPPDINDAISAACAVYLTANSLIVPPDFNGRVIAALANYLAGPGVPLLPAVPGVAATYVSVHGCRKMLATAGANTRRVVGTSTIDIPLLGTGLEDRSGIAALGATVKNSIWYDQTTSAFDIIQATGGNQPIYAGANQSASSGSITTGIASATGLFASTFMTRNVGATVNSRSFTWIQVLTYCGGASNSYSTGAIGTGTGGAGTGGGLSSTYDNTNNASPLYIVGSSDATLQFKNTTTKAPPVGTKCIVTIQGQAAASIVRINGKVQSNSAVPNVALAGGFLGKGAWSGTTSCWADIESDILITGDLTGPETIALETQLAVMHGIAAYPTNVCGWDGDSIPQYGQTYGHGWAYQVARLTTAPWYLPDFAIGGQTTANVNARRATTFAQINALATLLGSTKKAVHNNMGTNDIDNLASGVIVGAETAISAAIVAYYAAAIAAGIPAASCIYATIIPRAWVGSGTDVAQKDVVRVNCNSLTVAALTGMGVQIDDSASLIGAGTTGLTTGAANNPPTAANYIDLVHPNGGTAATIAGGYALMAPLSAARLNAI